MGKNCCKSVAVGKIAHKRRNRVQFATDKAHLTYCCDVGVNNAPAGTMSTTAAVAIKPQGILRNRSPPGTLPVGFVSSKASEIDHADPYSSMTRMRTILLQLRERNQSRQQQQQQQRRQQQQRQQQQRQQQQRGQIMVEKKHERDQQKEDQLLGQGRLKRRGREEEEEGKKATEAGLVAPDVPLSNASINPSTASLKKQTNSRAALTSFDLYRTKDTWERQENPTTSPPQGKPLMEVKIIYIKDDEGKGHRFYVPSHDTDVAAILALLKLKQQ